MKGLQRSISRGPKASRGVVTDRIIVRGGAFTVDGTAVGFGTLPVGDFPAGNILFLGAAAYITTTKDDADISDTFNGDFAIGTTPLSDGTMTAGDVDLVPSTATTVAAAGVSPRTRGVSATAVAGTIYDNTDGSLELNLNLLIDDADISDDGAVLVDLDLDITYVVLGDD